MYSSISLPYSYDALEPFLSARTVSIHFQKHYLKYLDNLNNILSKYAFSYTKEELIDNISLFPIDIRDDILYNVGGVLNHELYFLNLSKNGTNLSGKIKEKIDLQYGSYDNFVSEFKKEARKLVGSGYTFLVLTKNGDLNIINTSNQETPYLYGFFPLLTIDLWEHAYYLDYQNDRNRYIDSFFQNIDFNYVNKRYEEAVKKITK